MEIDSGKAIKIGWEETKKNFWPIVGIFALNTIIPIIIQNIGKSDGHQAPLMMFLSFIITCVMGAGIRRISLNILEKKSISVSLLYSEYRFAFPIFISTLISSILTVIGLLLFLIPGIIIGLRLSMSNYEIVEKDLSGIEGLKSSWKLTEGHTWNLFFFALYRIGVMFLGVLALGFGVFVAIPVSAIATAHIYKTLNPNKSLL